MENYIKSGTDKMVIDPDPDEIYTKRRKRISNAPNNTSSSSPSVQHPSDGWGKSLERMPSFTRTEMNQHNEFREKRGKHRTLLDSNQFEESKNLSKR